ncbi:MAG: hypothetical protein BWK80_36260 [Desulfobacteraceae bacterium IS3]|nr:MAG: hypothetical protein BWK80_36260 [Desulfobacteraceae bacterium IS3]
MMTKNKPVAIFVLAAFLFLGMTGCSSLESKDGNMVSRILQRDTKGTPSIYRDFGDVLIPGDLKVDNDSSFIYQTPGFTGGVLGLKGRVDLPSLISFFESNMSKDNWKKVSAFKSPRSIMLFHKENRWCVISMSEGRFSTYVEIWVSPTITETGVEKKEGIYKSE